MPWFLLALRKYATFEGRSRRSEYWYFVLFCLLIVGVLGLLDALFGTYVQAPQARRIGLLSGLFALAMLLPMLAVTCRRLHDTGRAGWWLLIACIPVIGAIVLLVLLARDSEQAVNEHGGNPKLSMRYAQPRFG